jgi:hypothetical protein
MVMMALTVPKGQKEQRVMQDRKVKVVIRELPETQENLALQDKPEIQERTEPLD